MEQKTTIPMQKAPVHHAIHPPRWTAFVFALTVLGAGILPGVLTFAFDPGASARIGQAGIPIPAWVFTLVWLIAYPSMGYATWLVWRLRGKVDVTVPIALFVAAFLQSLSFWLANSIRMIAVIDVTGLVLAYTVAWVYSRYTRAAVWWLLPWLVWMPITLAFKLWALYSGAQ